MKCQHCASELHWGGGQPHRSAVAAKARDNDFVRELGRVAAAITADKNATEEPPDQTAPEPSFVLSDEVSLSELIRLAEADDIDESDQAPDQEHLDTSHAGESNEALVLTLVLAGLSLFMVIGGVAMFVTFQSLR